MSRVKSEIVNSFQAIANTNFALSVNQYGPIREYNNNYLEQLKAYNATGERVTLPPHMAYRTISRGEILQFGDELIMDPETGNIICYPKEVFEEKSKYTVELPCAMGGEVEDTLNRTLAALPKNLRKKIEEENKGITARFRTVPFLEKYTGQELED